VATSNSLHITAYVLSLIGGIIILIVSLVSLVWFAANGSSWGGFGGWMSGMMNRYHGFGAGAQADYTLFTAVSIIAIFSGAIVILGAVMLHLQPRNHITWGVLILIFAIVSFADMGGLLIGAILGIVGGALALSYRPPAQAQTQPQPMQQQT